ncbi:unnamed protein product [Aphanomyces euteiches]|uniref:Xylose isomerase-like TIM barrel domain-containing protein n=1 Tax=Aphanomyces euteiches TaxID=100861 RepID=A0A6G0XS57_9STRA|nr:hypothetical protein Ae201684_001899 [Aphanomyces euteiches]KAH9089537.1 hypothetical protein Ae201684P_007706 [Aphanomyces euteiches]KAH9155800.1 hypothetical protein AeRB84_002267 [Aphanomyces euteiches]
MHGLKREVARKSLSFLAPQWGSADLARDEFIKRVKDAGFDGIEMSLPLDVRERDSWIQAIRGADLKLVTQQWETALHPNFTDHKKNLEIYLRNATSASPLLVNTHTGKDFFTFEQNCELIQLTQDIIAETGIRIVHEIHRSRFSGHPMLFLPYLNHFPNIELNADLSHWCVVCESLLEDQEEMLTQQVFPRVRHIHARVGHSQAPQVTDFRAPEHLDALTQHLKWWDAIVDLGHVETITPEFGPTPYTPTLPYTDQIVSDPWELNVAMLHLLRSRYLQQ